MGITLTIDSGVGMMLLCLRALFFLYYLKDLYMYAMRLRRMQKGQRERKPACIWFLAWQKEGAINTIECGGEDGFRDRPEAFGLGL